MLTLTKRSSTLRRNMYLPQVNRAKKINNAGSVVLYQQCRALVGAFFNKWVSEQ